MLTKFYQHLENIFLCSLLKIMKATEKEAFKQFDIVKFLSLPLLKDCMILFKLNIL